MNWQRTGFTVDTDPGRLDFDVIHGFLTTSYWTPGINREKVEKAARNSLCFGVYDGTAQVGFARVISDQTSFAYLADVFILESHRRKGLARMLLECILDHPELQGLRTWLLKTRDAHDLYRKVGFSDLKDPERFLVKT